MGSAAEHRSGVHGAGNHFSCSMTSCLVERVRESGGDAAVAEMLELAGSARTPEYLTDLANWISYDEAVALWAAGARVTQHPQFARAVGEDAARRLNASPVAALLRSLGSPENVYRQIATTATKYSVVTTLEAVEVGPGCAEIVATTADGFARDPHHCAWTCGLLSQPTILFGLGPATVTHERCEVLGAPDCRYTLTWDAQPESGSDASAEVRALEHMLSAAHARLHGIFETAGDLIAADEIGDALARITDRAALEVRAQRYLLAVRFARDGELHLHHTGFDEPEVAEYAERILEEHAGALPENWLVVPVCSARRDYGRLLAMYEPGHRFFPQERDLLEVYARYAASALDGATALMEAQQRYEQSTALLALARALAAAGTRSEVAVKLAEAVPAVVDCDRVGVYLWDPDRGELVRYACTSHPDVKITESETFSRAPTPGGAIARLMEDPSSEPMFIDDHSGDPILRELSASIGAVATMVVPLATADSLLGVLTTSVLDRRERLEPNPDLLDRLSGVAAQATTALQNGWLVDQITHRALHDDLTGLANRPQFTGALSSAVDDARRTGEHVALYYLDLDDFKPVNDQYGHMTGDQLLVAVGKRLASCIRAPDVVARLGGDEFAVLVRGARVATADHAAVHTRLAAAFDHPFTIEGIALQLGISIGCAVFPEDAGSSEALMRHADAAMFATKRVHHEVVAATAPTY